MTEEETTQDQQPEIRTFRGTVEVGKLSHQFSVETESLSIVDLLEMSLGAPHVVLDEIHIVASDYWDLKLWVIFHMYGSKTRIEAYVTVSR